MNVRAIRVAVLKIVVCMMVGVIAGLIVASCVEGSADKAAMIGGDRYHCGIPRRTVLERNFVFIDFNTHD